MQVAKDFLEYLDYVEVREDDSYLVGEVTVGFTGTA